jgi:DNA ligase 1
LQTFATLIRELSVSTKTNDKLASLADYFSKADDRDKVWVIALFSGRRPKRAVSGTLLQQWCAELTGLPVWLFEECYHTVGDLAETIALLVPEPEKENSSSIPLHQYLEKLTRWGKEDEQERKAFVLDAWQRMNQSEKFVFNKLLTGGFRIGVSQNTMVNALARTVNLPPSKIAHLISGNWNPSTLSFSALLNEDGSAIDHSKPYPFYLAYPLEEDLSTLGEPGAWQAEWKWDGIRGQIIKRNNELFVWSRGEELMTEKFPEYAPLKELLPNGLVLDGEIICCKPGGASDSPIGNLLGFQFLQTRIGRKNITKKQLQEAPVAFFAYDLLEYEGRDYREQPLLERRRVLSDIIAAANHPSLFLSPVLSFDNWKQLTEIRTQAREMNSEGLMLKRKDSVYQNGRKRGDWWKWKTDPFTIDAVMIYAQKGHGRRSNLYTDYTFAVRDGDKLVSFAKAYSGLTDKEFLQVDAFVKAHSIEKFGPVRTVEPVLVFEIAFEGIAESKRHKSGVALRFPRMSRWRKDKTVEDINTLEDLKQLGRLSKKSNDSHSSEYD